MTNLVAQGMLTGIAIREKSRAPMEELRQAPISVLAGLRGDFRGRPGQRQITVLAAEPWEIACNELRSPIHWTVRRANLLIEGIDLKSSAGSMLRIGDVTLRITGETEPCQRMDEQHAGLCAALVPDWRAGVCCRVEADGEVSIGDTVELLREAE